MPLLLGCHILEAMAAVRNPVPCLCDVGAGIPVANGGLSCDFGGYAYAIGIGLCSSGEVRENR